MHKACVLEVQHERIYLWQIYAGFKGTNGWSAERQLQICKNGGEERAALSSSECKA